MKYFWEVNRQKNRIALKRANRRNDLKKPKEAFALIQLTQSSWGSLYGGEKATLISLPKYLLDDHPENITRFFVGDISQLPIVNKWGQIEFCREKELSHYSKLFELIGQEGTCKVGRYGPPDRILYRQRVCELRINGTISQRWENKEEPEVPVIIKNLGIRIMGELISSAKWQKERNSSITGDMLNAMIEYHYKYNC